MKTALIVNAYSANNIGDAAIILSTAKILRDIGAEEVITSSRYYADDTDFYRSQGIKMIPAVLPFQPRGSQPEIRRALTFGWGVASFAIVSGLLRLSRGLALNATRILKAPGLSSMIEADTVVIAGGGYLYSSKRPLDLTLMSNVFTIIAASALNKNVVMMPQSVGPLNRKLDNLLVKRALRGLRRIVLRDNHSISELKELQTDPAILVQCPDIAFHGWQNRTPISADRPATNRVGLSVMDWTWSDRGSPTAYESYIQMMTRLIRSLLENGRDVVLTGMSSIQAQDQDDFAVAEALVDRLRPSGGKLPTIARPRTPNDFIELTRTMDVFVGTRLHSSIISLVGGTPALGLAYQPKTEGTYALLGLEDWCTDIRLADPTKLEQLVDGILANPLKARRRVREAVEAARFTIEHTYETCNQDSKVDVA